MMWQKKMKFCLIWENNGGDSDGQTCRLTTFKGLSSINQDTDWEFDMKDIFFCVDLPASFEIP